MKTDKNDTMVKAYLDSVHKRLPVDNKDIKFLVVEIDCSKMDIQLSANDNGFGLYYSLYQYNEVVNRPTSPGGWIQSVKRLFSIIDVTNKKVYCAIFGKKSEIEKSIKLIETDEKYSNCKIVNLKDSRSLFERYYDKILVHVKSFEQLPKDIQQQIYKKFTGKDNMPEDREEIRKTLNEPSDVRYQKEEAIRKQKEELEKQEYEKQQIELKKYNDEVSRILSLKDESLILNEVKTSKLFEQLLEKHRKISNYPKTTDLKEIPFKRWGYANGWSLKTRIEFRIEELIHDVVMKVYPELHNISVEHPTRNSEDITCTCGFEHASDYS